MADVSLNGLKVKTDSLPNDWYVSLINPKSEEPAEIMTVAKFIELFLTNNKVWTANNDGPDSKLDADLLDGKDGYSYVSNLGRITDLNKISYNSVYNYSNGAVNAPNTYGVVLSLANWSKFEEGKQDQWLNQLAFGTNNTIYFRQKINTEDWTQWRTVGLNTSAYSLNANALTDTISENYSILPPPANCVPNCSESAGSGEQFAVSAISETDNPDGSIPVRSEPQEQYVWSIDKIGKAVLELQEENKRLKQILNISDDSEVQQM